jgi:NAD-dependent deacetylase
MPGVEIPPRLLEALRGAARLVALTGSGISAEKSGVPTFRDAQTGLWERYDPQELATPEAFARDPRVVWGWYEW